MGLVEEVAHVRRGGRAVAHSNGVLLSCGVLRTSRTSGHAGCVQLAVRDVVLRLGGCGEALQGDAGGPEIRSVSIVDEAGFNHGADALLGALADAVDGSEEGEPNGNAAVAIPGRRRGPGRPRRWLKKCASWTSPRVEKRCAIHPTRRL